VSPDAKYTLIDSNAASNNGLALALRSFAPVPPCAVTLTITAGTVAFASDASLICPDITIEVKDGGSVVFNANQNLAALKIIANTSEIGANGNRVVVTKDLFIDSSARFDIKDNAVIVDYTGASPATTIRGYITTGLGGGNGIKSSVLNASTSIGYADNDTLVNLLGTHTSFYGQSIDPTTILIRHTLVSDMDLDGKVGDNDVTLLGGFYDFGAGSNHVWAEGDVNYDGKLDTFDENALRTNYNEFAAPIGGAVI
jgi:hypothetical protein